MTNAEFEIAEQFALHTRRHCFVTGKAGTGKTTLLKRIVEQTHKNVVVVAPTGVAAINAGGVTIHSMFGLPLTCFTPNDDPVDLNVATNRRGMREHLHFREEKLRVLREMDLLIVDEVSMVRCDTLDAIDFVLRTIRGSAQPFGGVQVLLFGDMHQLPPVVKEVHWSILNAWYRSPYFFDSMVWPQLHAAEIELQTIYRQSDARFLALLNHIRNRQMDADDLERLRERYDPDFAATAAGYVLLATHNQKADSVNAAELEKLPGKLVAFEAQIEGEFPAQLFPCDAVLHLKLGAQVMFIRNDSAEGRYYNGKLAVVKALDDANITVTFNDSGEDYALHREVWENVGYSVEAESGSVMKQELGSFSQFPLRLAWAITIHKSQGLTFDRIIVDAGRSFAAGQVYVALSRCRSLEGIVLSSLITPRALHGDRRIGEFSVSHHSTGDLRDALPQEKALYANHLLLRLFTFTGLSAPMQGWRDLIAKMKTPEREAAAALCTHIDAQQREICVTADKFQRQLQRLTTTLESAPGNAEALRERCAQAIEYFTNQIAAQLIAPLRAHTGSLSSRKKMKRYLRQVQLIEETCWSKIDRLYGGRFMDQRLYVGEARHTRDRVAQAVPAAASAKKEKGSTYRETLDWHRQGKAAEEIAAIRGLSVSTIKGHFARLIASGEIDVYSVLPAATVDPVMSFLRADKDATVTAIRSGLGDSYDYNDIRMIVSHHSRSAAQRQGENE